jgi:hypothetical protein
MKYTPADLPIVRERLADLREEQDRSEKDYVNSHPIGRLRLLVDLLERGIDAEEQQSGYLVGDGYCLAYQKRRWRAPRSGNWYWYSTLDEFVERYIHRREPATGPKIARRA